MKEFFRGMYQKPHFGRRFFLCLFAVAIMGFCVSWLSFVHLGTDPCSVMNIGISNRIGMTLGNWQALLNIFLFVIVILMDKSQIGFGTILNMFVVGYAYDATTWAREKLFPNLVCESFWMRIFLMVILLAIFVVVAAIYMSVDLGTAPYDAIPMIIGKRQQLLSFRMVRVIWDCSVTVIGYFAGGVVGIVTVLMAFTLGPVIAWVGKHIKQYIE